MSALLERVRAAAEARAAERRAELVDLLEALLPGMRIESDDRGVRLSGRGVRQRWAAAGLDHGLRSLRP